MNQLKCKRKYPFNAKVKEKADKYYFLTAIEFRFWVVLHLSRPD